MTWSQWLEDFESNANCPLPAVSTEGLPSDPAIRAALARSLAILQLGETGEGRIAKEVWGFRTPTVDDHWRRSVGLFVREEGRHSVVLGRALAALGGRPAQANWTDDLFVWGRRLLGVRLKLLVLLAAEVVSVTFYRALADALPGSSVGRALGFIEAEEARHLAFHAEFFAKEVRTRTSRWIFRLAWWAVGLAACAVVLVDHRRTLRVLGIGWLGTGRRFCALLQEVSSSVREDRRLETDGREAGSPLGEVARAPTEIAGATESERGRTAAIRQVGSRRLG